MREAFIRIIALVAAMVLGTVSVQATEQSLAERTGETYCLSCAYCAVVHGDADMASYDYAEFREWATEYAASVGMVYDRSASGNIAILHARSAVSPMASIVPVGTGVVSATVHSVAAGDATTTGAVGIAAVGEESYVESSVMPAPYIAPAVVSLLTSADGGVMPTSIVTEPAMRPMGRRMVLCDIGINRSTTLYDLWELSVTGIREDDRRYEYAWRRYVQKWGSKHPIQGVQMETSDPRWTDEFRAMTAAVMGRSTVGAWYALTCNRRWREVYIETVGREVVVMPYVRPGGSAGVAVGTGLHKVSAAKSRRACSKTKED